jgi:hypothetical protein
MVTKLQTGSWNSAAHRGEMGVGNYIFSSFYELLLGSLKFALGIGLGTVAFQ